MPDITQSETIDALLMKLHKTDFVYRTYVRVEEDEEDNIIKRQMIQL